MRACACVCAVVVEWRRTDIDGSDAACLVPCGSVHGVAWMTGTDSKGRVGGQCRASEPWAALRGSPKLNRRTGGTAGGRSKKGTAFAKVKKAGCGASEGWQILHITGA